MSSRQTLKSTTSSTAPVGATVGDEWFSPTTNKFYKFMVVSGVSPTWVEVPSYASGALSVGNLSVTGGTGSFVGSTSNLAMTFNNAGETVTIASGLTGANNIDVTVQSIVYYTSVSANWSINFRGSSTTTLNSIMSIGQSVSVVVMATNGASAYLPSAVYIDGAAVTPKWQGGSAPASGNTTSIDMYSYVIIKTANSTYTVLCSQTKFA